MPKPNRIKSYSIPHDLRYYRGRRVRYGEMCSVLHFDGSAAQRLTCRAVSQHVLSLLLHCTSRNLEYRISSLGIHRTFKSHNCLVSILSIKIQPSLNMKFLQYRQCNRQLQYEQAASLTETIRSHTRLVIKISILGIWDLGLLLGYLATSGAKCDVIFLLGDRDFL